MMTAGSDGMVRFWDPVSGRELRSLSWGIGKVYAAAFSPDGLTCAAGGEKGQVVIWDVDE
jgi:WD40 repeat protein